MNQMVSFWIFFSKRWQRRLQKGKIGRKRHRERRERDIQTDRQNDTRAYSQTETDRDMSRHRRAGDREKYPMERERKLKEFIIDDDI